MKKLTILLAGLFLLSGCVQVSDLPSIVENTLQQQSSKEMPAGTNMTKKYYSYYLPKDMGRLTSTMLGEVFLKDNLQIVMNFDPSAIIIRKYYPTDEQQAQINVEPVADESEEAKTARVDAENAKLQTVVLDETLSTEAKKIYKGSYRDSFGHVQSYEMQLLNNGDNYLMYFDFTVVKFYSIVPLASVESVANAVLMIAKSIDYDEDYVLSNFSMKKTGEARKQTIESLQQNLSTNGSFVDLIENNESENVPNPDGRH